MRYNNNDGASVTFLGIAGTIAASILALMLGSKIGIALGLTGSAAAWAGAGIILGGLLVAAGVITGLCFAGYGIYCYAEKKHQEKLISRAYQLHAQAKNADKLSGGNTKDIANALGQETAIQQNEVAVTAAPVVKKQNAIANFFSNLFGKKKVDAPIQEADQQPSPKLT